MSIKHPELEGCGDPAVGTMDSTRILSGGKVSVHSRAIASISGDGGVPNLVTVSVSPLDHNLTTGAKIIVTGTTGFNEATQQTITVTGDSTFTYSTTTNTATGPESTGTISANSLFELAVGRVLFVDHSVPNGIENPKISKFSFGPFFAQEVTDIATTVFTLLSLNVLGEIIQSGEVTTKQRRSQGVLAVLTHTDLATIEFTTNKFPVPNPVAVLLALFDDFEARGPVNLGGSGENVYSANGINLRMDKTGGRIFSMGEGRLDDIQDLNRPETPAGTELFFFTTWRTSSADRTPLAGVGPQQDVDIGVYDDGTGGTPLPNGIVPNNRFVIHRLYLTSVGTTVLQFGQNTYLQLSVALDNLRDDSFIRTTPFDAVLIRAALIVKSNVTDLSDVTEALFIEADKNGRF